MNSDLVVSQSTPGQGKQLALYALYGVVLLAVPVFALGFLGMLPSSELFASSPLGWLSQDGVGSDRLARVDRREATASFATILRNWEYTTHCLNNPNVGGCGNCADPASGGTCGPLGTLVTNEPACCPENGGTGCSAQCAGCCLGN
jgi:hypothetical protein